MPTCALPNNQGFLHVVNLDDVANCTGYVMVNLDEYNLIMDYTQVTALEIAEHFTVGFSLVFVFGYLMTLGIKAAIKVIELL